MPQIVKISIYNSDQVILPIKEYVENGSLTGFCKKLKIFKQDVIGIDYPVISESEYNKLFKK